MTPIWSPKLNQKFISIGNPYNTNLHTQRRTNTQHKPTHRPHSYQELVHRDSHTQSQFTIHTDTHHCSLYTHRTHAEQHQHHTHTHGLFTRTLLDHTQQHKVEEHTRAEQYRGEKRGGFINQIESHNQQAPTCDTRTRTVGHTYKISGHWK